MTIDCRASKYKCPTCGGRDFGVSTTRWRCTSCGGAFACVGGIPKLYIDEDLGAQDRKLRDSFYDGVFGRFYQFMMPFIVMPVRPLSISWPHWITFAGAWVVLATLAVQMVNLLTTPGGGAGALAIAVFLTFAGWFLARQSYLLHLLLLAFPVWLSVSRRPFSAAESFVDVHARVIEPLKAAGRQLQVLDVSTGSCNSLYRHGWMSLDADYTAIDLSETMLKQGLKLMSANGVAVDLVLGDAMNLPFQDGQFDVVLSYGAVNGITDPVRAIAEMARVAKPGGVLLFLDEQMYPAANRLEAAYFHKVLSSHNVIHHCPVEQMPKSLADVRVAQVYQFYYICTARKLAA